MRGILQFITQTLWKTLFGVTADNLQRSVDSEDEYMIIEKVVQACLHLGLLARLDQSPYFQKRRQAPPSRRVFAWLS